MTSTVATQPLLLFSLAKKSGCLCASAASPQPASAWRYASAAILAYRTPLLGEVGYELRVERVTSPTEVGVIPFGGLEQVGGALRDFFASTAAVSARGI